jgi:hypothetical protein
MIDQLEASAFNPLCLAAPFFTPIGVRTQIQNQVRNTNKTVK